MVGNGDLRMDMGLPAAMDGAEKAYNECVHVLSPIIPSVQPCRFFAGPLVSYADEQKPSPRLAGCP